MKDGAIDVAVEVAKNGEPDLVLTTLIFISAAVFIAGMCYLVYKFYEGENHTKPLLEKIECLTKMTNTLCEDVVISCGNNNELRSEVKEIRGENAKIAETLTKVSTHIEMNTQVLTQLLGRN